MTNWLGAYRAWTESTTGKRVLRIIRWLFVIAMLVWMTLKVNAIGWRKVSDSLPVTPWFYILFLAMFLTLPISETAIFQRIYDRPMARHLAVFIRKRVLNSALVGYSGEVYFFLWARHNLSIPAKQLLVGLKDNAILSAVAAAMVTAGLVVLFLLSGQADLVTRWLNGEVKWFLAAALIAAFLLPVMLAFRNKIIGLSLGVAGSVLGLHVVRTVIVMGLQVTQWAVVIPDQPWKVWLFFLTMQMVIARLPFIPNRELLFLSAGLEMSNAIDGPREAMAGLLLAGGALTQGSNLIFFLLTSIRRPNEVPIGESLPSDETMLATPPAK
ncbi:hypothetical protein GCM10023219_08440 [Stakelama sediminis]|uniref:Flippase-like domain-containing protein n=1 Tax=Stakelama sediminis TaxID=463200 RepID=A0A840YVH3_9SPHN|nr:hypothetical protein [Stakelama sediminis]MBB5717566.1 hypothetical protein [Stakelama sediminis]